MDIFLIGSIVMALAIFAGSAAFAFRLLRVYRQPFLLFYLYFLLAHNGVGLARVLIDFLSSHLALAPASTGFRALDIQLLAFIFPLVPLSVFMFIKLTGSLVGRPGHKGKDILFWGAWGTVFILFILGGMRAVNGNNTMWLTLANISANVLTFLVIYTSLWQLVFSRDRGEQTGKNPVARPLGRFYLIGFSLYLIIAYGVRGADWAYFIMPLVYMTINLPPLFFLHRVLKPAEKSPAILPEKNADLTAIFNTYKISPREQEILRLILQGKTNKEIEDEIFISLKTVKNHIYNIYRKLGVNSRLQLINKLNSLIV